MLTRPAPVEAGVNNPTSAVYRVRTGPVTDAIREPAAQRTFRVPTKRLAYEKWLGIKAEHQPPSLYRLLAIDAFEGDMDVISPDGPIVEPASYDNSKPGKTRTWRPRS